MAFRLQSPPQRGRMPSRRGTTGFLAVAPLSGRLSWLRGEVPARWQAGVLCHALSRLAARGRRQTRRRCFGRTSVRWFATHSAVSPRGGGRLRCPDDARAAPREAGVRRHAAALVGHLAAGLLRTQVSCRGRADDCIARMMRESRPCEVAVGRRAIAFVGRLIIGSPRIRSRGRSRARSDRVSDRWRRSYRSGLQRVASPCWRLTTALPCLAISMFPAIVMSPRARQGEHRRGRATIAAGSG